MSRNKAKTKNRGSAGAARLGSLGLLDINNLNFDGEAGDDDDIDEGDLEAELSALLSGKGPKKREEPKQKAAPIDLNQIQALASVAMKDDVSDHESDYEGIENDPDLLAELEGLGGSEADSMEETPQPVPAALRPSTVPISSPTSASLNSASPQDIVDVLQARIQNYQEAQNAAQQLDDSSKVRRYGRALKSLKDQLKLAQLGKAIPEADIAPPVAIPKARPPPPTEDISAMSVSEAAPLPQPLQPPAEVAEPPVLPEKTTEQEPPPMVPRRSGTYPPPEIAEMLGDPEEDFDPTEHLPKLPMRPDNASRPQPKIPSRPAPVPPASASVRQMPAEPTDQRGLLLFRRDQYKRAAVEAKHQGNTELALKHLKIVKQFDSVSKALDAGNPIDLSGMPGPPESCVSVPKSEDVIPGYIDMNAKEDPQLYKAPPAAETVLDALQQRLAKYEESEAQAKADGNSSKARRVGRIVKDYRDAIVLHKAGKPVDYDELPVPPGFGPIPVQTPQTTQKPPAPPKQPAVPAASQAQKRPPPKPHPQKQFLLERQRMFREAAADALKNASKEQALEYLRMSKGIQPMIDAVNNGLPIDVTTIPIPPQLQQDFVVLEPENSAIQLSVESEELYKTLEEELESQFDMCQKNKENFFKLGDVVSGSKFEKLGQDAKRDLSVLRANRKRGDPLPRFRYEDRVYTIVRHNHDVLEDKMQVCVVRGIALPGKPNELDSYLKIDFGYPTESPQTYRSSTAKNTTNPLYEATCSFEIARKSRSFIRALKRITVKIEVWSKRGFLRYDELLGTAVIKLNDLETKCEIHDVFPLLDGRRDTSAKLEVKIRITQPFTTKQIEEIKQRWLIIGS